MRLTERLCDDAIRDAGIVWEESSCLLCGSASHAAAMKCGRPQPLQASDSSVTVNATTASTPAPGMRIARRWRR